MIELDERAKELLEAAFQARESFLNARTGVVEILAEITWYPNDVQNAMLASLYSKYRKAAIDFTEYCMSATFHK